MLELRTEPVLAINVKGMDVQQVRSRQWYAIANPHDVLCLQVGQWLRANKLAAYVAVFCEMEITGENVCELDDSELKELFVRPLEA